MNDYVDKLKEDFDIQENLTPLIFTRFSKTPYPNKNKEAAFGEKLCILYRIEFMVYHIRYSLKILAFAYEKSHEILKLDTRLPDDVHLEKELATFRNFLRRYRNLNATFRLLIRFSELFESRRLITDTVLTKQDKVTLKTNDEGCLFIVYSSVENGILIRFSWKIEWNIKERHFMDVIDVAYNDFILGLPNARYIEKEMTVLTHHSLDFGIKLKIWRLLMIDLRNAEEWLEQKRTRCKKSLNTNGESVLVISDSEDEIEMIPTNEIRGQKQQPRTRESPVIYLSD
ncbi:uncharacterized protein [Leptinotarsa decemlineata]|uniref:uncharacterized protein n=1 Tax=Leptinotarsa decemlineata TaxID=7539 RepID=UPI003D304B61